MYTVVCSSNTSQLWPRALSRLVQKQESRWPGEVHVVLYKGETPEVASCLQQLSRLKPHFCCFLTHHSECSKSFVQEVNQITRELDPSHPYTDTIWGILTGLTEDDVLMALEHKPLVISRVVANCPVDLEKFQTGLWFSESEQGVSYCKFAPESEAVRTKCPDDATEQIIEELSAEKKLSSADYTEHGVDMVISSGHATENNWNIAYCFAGGTFLCEEGQLYGSTRSGKCIDVRHSKNPKVLSAAGNCLVGHISHRSCMALGWMHSANVVQMVGYVEPTWFGYGGWGVHKYFINNPGSMSLAEAFFANQQSLIHCLHSEYSEHIAALLGDHRSIYDRCFNTSLSGLDGAPRECCGLLYDQNNVAFYGDPAWAACLKTNLNVYDYTSSLDEVCPPLPLSEDSKKWCHWKFVVTTQRPGKWNCPIPDDKSTCPGRPPMYIFPTRLCSPSLVKGEAVLTERFVLLPLKGSFESGEQHIVHFKSRKQ